MQPIRQIYPPVRYRPPAPQPAELAECDQAFDCSKPGACGVVKAEHCPLSRWREVADQLHATLAALPRPDLD